MWHRVKMKFLSTAESCTSVVIVNKNCYPIKIAMNKWYWKSDNYTMFEFFVLYWSTAAFKWVHSRNFWCIPKVLKSYILKNLANSKVEISLRFDETHFMRYLIEFDQIQRLMKLLNLQKLLINIIWPWISEFVNGWFIIVKIYFFST